MIIIIIVTKVVVIATVVVVIFAVIPNVVVVVVSQTDITVSAAKMIPPRNIETWAIDQHTRRIITSKSSVA